MLKSFLDKDKFKSEIFIPEKVKDTIKNININLKGKIKYHLTSHWLNFFFSLQNVWISKYKKKNKRNGKTIKVL